MNDFWTDTVPGMEALTESLQFAQPVGFMTTERRQQECRCSTSQRGRSPFRRFIERYVTRSER